MLWRGPTDMCGVSARRFAAPLYSPLGLLALLPAMVTGYLQPTGPTLDQALPGAGVNPAVWARSHGDITMQAIKLLAADGKETAAKVFDDPELVGGVMDGLRQADSGGGEFIMSMYGSAGRAPRNSFTHFYNPLTKEGFVFPIPSTQGLQLSPDPHLMMRTRWEVSLMMGPMPSALDSLNWEYGRAVTLLRDGQRKAAFTALGRAIHILQDVTVPHHSTDKPAGLPGTKHTEYEALCEAILKNATLGLSESVHPAEGGIYCDTCPPQEFVETAANQSARFISAAMQPGTEQATAVAVGLGRIVALHHRPSTLYHIC
jgi:hypothetical protein